MPENSTGHESVIGLVASTVAIFNIAIAQPLLDLVGRHAEFFVARKSPGSDIILVAATVALVVPLGLAVVLLGIRRINMRLGTALHRVVLAALMACLALQILKRTPGFRSGPGVLDVAAAAAVGAGAALVYARSKRLRGMAWFGSVIPILVGGLFLFGSPVSRIAFAGEVAPARSESARIGNPAPVVMVVLDEFPVASLMDEHGEVDAHLFPNFARLSRDGVWFRNATTVHEATAEAVPAILTGLMPTGSRLPLAVDHPKNLFTLLAGDYDTTAIEPITALCPAGVCRAPACSGEGCGETGEKVSRSVRLHGLASDLRIVFLHMLLPNDLARTLPSIGNSWTGFANTEDPDPVPASSTESSPDGSVGWKGVKPLFREALNKDRARAFRQFVASIEPTKRPHLYFLHALLPHYPWAYAPSGRTFRLTRFIIGDGKRWPDDPWLAAQAYQRHLLQVQFTDSLIGELLAKLQREGLYEKSLLVVTADHGAGFHPNSFRRAAAEDNIGEIAAVPLFIKRPYERHGGVSDRPVESIDVLPTIADSLDVKGVWKTDGVSAFQDTRPQRTEKTILNGPTNLVFPATGMEKLEVVRRKYGLFAHEGDSLNLFALGPYADLMGRRVEDLSLGARATAAIRPSDPNSYRTVDTAGNLPTPLTGSIEGDLPSPVEIAVAVNGTIRSVTQPWKVPGRTKTILALLPPEAFHKGRNTLRFFIVTTTAGRRVLGELSCRGCP